MANSPSFFANNIALKGKMRTKSAKTFPKKRKSEYFVIVTVMIKLEYKFKHMN